MSSGIAHGDAHTPYIFGRKNVNYSGGAPAHSKDDPHMGTVISAREDFSSTVSIPSTIQECSRRLDSSADPHSEELDDIRTQLAYLMAESGSVPLSRVHVSEVMSDINQPDGGGTYNPITGKSPMRGFCYSPYPEHSVMYPSAEDFSSVDMTDYAREKKDILQRDNHFLGIWNDPKDEKNIPGYFRCYRIKNYNSQCY